MCEKLRRSFKGIELNPDYVEIAKRRIRQARQMVVVPEPLVPFELPVLGLLGAPDIQINTEEDAYVEVDE